MNYYELNADEIYSKNRALRIGFVGENEALKLYFTSAKNIVDVLGEGGTWLMACENTEYPDGFPLLCEYVDGKLVVIINSSLLSIMSRGKLQYTYTLGEQKKKSFKYGYSVDSSVLSSSTPPEPYESWVEHIDEEVNRIDGEVVELGNKVDGFEDELEYKLDKRTPITWADLGGTD